MFHALLDKFYDQYEPAGIVEELLVQTIATCWWKKARVLRAENVEIRKRLDTGAVDRALRDFNKGNFDSALSALDLDLYKAENQADRTVSTKERWSAMHVAQSDLRLHHAGREYLSDLLKLVKSEIVSDRYITEIIRRKLFLAFCFWDCTFAWACFHSGPSEGKREEGTSEKVVGKRTDEELAYLVGSVGED